MKRSLTAGLALALALGLCGCASQAERALEEENRALRVQITELRAQAEALAEENEALGRDGPGDASRSNPIDDFFAAAGEDASTNAAMQRVASAYRQAWREELEALLEDLEEWGAAEGQALAEDYRESVEAQRDALEAVLHLAATGGPERPADAADYPGSGFGLLVGAADAGVYRDAFYHLLWARFPGGAQWDWRFDADGAQAALGGD